MHAVCKSGSLLLLLLLPFLLLHLPSYVLEHVFPPFAGPNYSYAKILAIHSPSERGDVQIFPNGYQRFGCVSVWLEHLRRVALVALVPHLFVPGFIAVSSCGRQ